METLEDYSAAAELIYPGLGRDTYAAFDRFNQRHFGGALPAMPIQWHGTLPYGGSLGMASSNQLILLGIYTHKQWCVQEGKLLPYGEHVLLHEMIHQHLFITGRNPNHNGQPWFSEIMRIGVELGMKPFVAARDKITKVRTSDGTRKSKRVPGGDITMDMISRFPHFAFDYTATGCKLKPEWKPQPTITVGRHNEPGAVYIGRAMPRLRLKASPLANPYSMADKSDTERNRVCDEYADWLDAEIESGNRAVIDELERLAAIARESGSITLGCFCSPKRCHGDTIKRKLEQRIG